VAVELGAPGRVDAGDFFVAWLLDVNVEHHVVDALAERPVTAGLEVFGRVFKSRAAGEGFGGNEGFAIDVRAR
jgi:hypothetical protein